MTNQCSPRDELDVGEVERLKWLVAELDRRHGIDLKAAPASQRGFIPRCGLLPVEGDWLGFEGA